MRAGGVSAPAAGFTLAEVIVATFVLALMVLTSNMLLSTVLRAQKNTESATFADAAIRAKLDELRFQPYSQLAAGTDQVTRVTRTWTVSETSGVKQVEVRASWLDIDGHTRAVSGVTMMTD